MSKAKTYEIRITYYSVLYEDIEADSIEEAEKLAYKSAAVDSYSAKATFGGVESLEIDGEEV